ncbi:MAG: sucrose phosphorylase, partial [Clostridia bacterium]|nr:sucrose phosphorylase [Clostridia bacterium]
LDAFAYTIKKADTSCFFVEPETWDLLKYVEDILKDEGAGILPEIHEHYSIQMKLAEKGFYVYDFALPMLGLHALYSGDSKRLINWLKICPRNQFTTLDTHDGIGVVDVKDLLTDEEIEMTRDNLYKTGANVKMVYSSAAYNNLDIYQMNCTYYSALGNNDQAYLLARAIQFFTPGIPQVYYVGLLAGANDIELVERTKNGRDINRHNYTLKEIDEEVQRPVVQQLFKLMKFRNEHPAFDGEITVEDHLPASNLHITWKKGEYQADLIANLQNYNFVIEYTSGNTADKQRLVL